MLCEDLSSAICYIVSPSFLEEWFQDFVSCVDGDCILYADDEKALAAEDVIQLFTFPNIEGCRRVAFCSSHRSLVRDCLVADTLRTQRYTITGINRSAMMYGQNKHLMKELFDGVGVMTPSWTLVHVGDTVSSVSARLGHKEYLFKEISETSGKGNFYFDAMPHQITDQYYAEVFVEGDEYSIVAVSTPRGIATFPPVWKGKTQRDLYPSYKKLRLCPFPGLATQLESRMRMITSTLAEAMGVTGLLEAEFVVIETGQILVIEVNPRVAGTVLLSAMATETKIFDLVGHGCENKEFQPTLCVAEMPFVGTSSGLSSEGVYFSPRLTVSGLTYQHIYEKIIQLGCAGLQVDQEALNDLRSYLDPGWPLHEQKKA